MALCSKTFQLLPLENRQPSAYNVSMQMVAYLIDREMIK
jgi:hypothetical protein